MRKIALLLVLALLLGTCSVHAEGPSDDLRLGDSMPDFRIATIDGQTFSLSSLLEQYDMVLLNFWATWCGPCRSEFPHMQEAYEKYKDKVAIVALSIEPTDTPDVLEAFRDEYGLSFFIGSDTEDFYHRFNTEGIPTSVAVDRFGKICLVQCGSLPDADSFARLFDIFAGEEYDQSVLLTEIPPVLPDKEGADSRELEQALSDKTGVFSFYNGTDNYDWPMQVTRIDGRSASMSTNSGVNRSQCRLCADFDAQAGDAIRVTFRLQSEKAGDYLRILIDGRRVKSFTGDKNWYSETIAIEESGTHLLELIYEKDASASQGLDCVWIDSVELLSGEAAEEAIKLKTVFPVSSESYLRPEGSARRIVMEDPSGMVEAEFSDNLFIIDADMASNDLAVFELGLTGDMDPDAAVIYSDYDGAYYLASELLNGGRYELTCGVDSVDTTGYTWSALYLYVDGIRTTALCYLKDEKDADIFAEKLTGQTGMPCSWYYAEQDEVEIKRLSSSTYIVLYVDQNGKPVKGAVCQVCDDTSCQLFTSDENGVCEFTLEPKEWEIHTLMVPAGYSGDTQTVTYARKYGGEYVFVLMNVTDEE